MKPVYSPQMLALFLQANAVDAAVRATGIDRLAGGKVPADEVVRQCEKMRETVALSKKVFARAWRGKGAVSAAHRQRLWLSLGIDPDIDDRGADR